MSKSTSSQELGERIEGLVQEHIAASRRAAQEAVARAFAASSSPTAPRLGRSAKARRQSVKRRTPAEIAGLGDRLYEAVCKKPGESMVVLASDVGSSVRELHLPMSWLKRDGRVRSVGQRDRMRYFPVGSDVQVSG